MKNKSIIVLMPLLLMVTMSCDKHDQESTNGHPLIGSWEMQETYWKLPDTTYAIKQAQPGILMINDNRYAIIWTPIEKPRTPFKILAKPTDEEAMAGFRSIVFNAGTYELTDSTLTTTAFVAKVPGFEKGKQYYRYNLNHDILTLTMFDELYPDGTKPEWSGRLTTEFVFKKVSDEKKK